MRISEVAHVDTMEHSCVHPAAHLLKEMCCHRVALPVSGRVTIRKHVTAAGNRSGLSQRPLVPAGGSLFSSLSVARSYNSVLR